MQGIGTTETRQAPPATKSLDFFEDFSRFSAHPSHNLLKSLCTKGKTNVRDVFYPSQIPHISLTSSLTSCLCSPKRNNLVVKNVRVILVVEAEGRDDLTQTDPVADRVL